MKTLPDFVRPDLEILAVGLNPSLNSVRAGYPFATSVNRFWPALNASRLVREPLEPGTAAMAVLLETYRIGFTDVVKRPTRGGGELRAADFESGARRLRRTIAQCRPRIVWFQGMVGYREFLRRVLGRRGERPGWGLQEDVTAAALAVERVFVTPNPSPANASYRLADLVEWFDRLATVRAALGTRRIE